MILSHHLQKKVVYNDSTFGERLALRLVRSLVTPERFILRDKIAKDLYLRGIFFARLHSGARA